MSSPPPIAPVPQLDETSVTVVSGMSQITSNFYNSAYYVLMNPSLLILFILVIGLFYALFSFVDGGGGSGSASSSTTATGSFGGLTSSVANTFTRFQDSVLETASGSGSGSSGSGSGWLWKAGLFLLLALFLIHAFQYAYSSQFITTLKNVFSPTPELDVAVVPQSSGGSAPAPKLLDKLRKQVFNVPGNNYTYDDAGALCKAYGARLATYQEVEQAYNQGGEWCQYGWSDNQMALFPTQQKTWDKLQTIEGHENDCGRPGVNGGYMANPKLRFGVNCYGVKPKMTAVEEELMATEPIYPKTVKDIEMEKRVEYWKSMLPEILVSPFNHNSWSKM